MAGQTATAQFLLARAAVAITAAPESRPNCAALS